MGFPGDGFLDPEVGDPLDTMQEDFDGGAAEMTGQAGGSHASSAKKRKKSAPVPPDEVVGDRIKQMKTQITGRKAADNAWTQTLRDKLDPDTVNVKLAGDRRGSRPISNGSPSHMVATRRQRPNGVGME